MEHRGLEITLNDSKEFESIPQKKWGMLDLPSGNLLSLQLAFEKKGTPMIRKGYWKDDGKAKLVKVGNEYKHVVEKYVLSPRKETPTPGIWASRLENLKQPYSPEDLKAIREGELVNYIVEKYGEFEFKYGDDFYRYGCDKTVIIVNDKEIEVSLPDVIGDDREALGIGFENDCASINYNDDGNKSSAEEITQNETFYKVGDYVSGEVTALNEFGAIVKIKDGCEAFLHISQITKEHGKKPSDLLLINEKIDARIIEIRDNGHIMSLSLY